MGHIQLLLLPKCNHPAKSSIMTKLIQQQRLYFTKLLLFHKIIHHLIAFTFQSYYLAANLTFT